VPSLALFGRQSTNTTGRLYVATEQEIIQFCLVESIEDIKNIFDFKEPTILLIRRDWGSGAGV